MQQQISVITLGVADIPRSRQFYGDGFGWIPVFENQAIVFYQMNGFVLGTFELNAMAADSGRTGFNPSGAYALAHNVGDRGEVKPLIERLIAAGGKLLRPADEPPHGGFRGYVTDPDDHAWEIAFNPAWAIDDKGHVTFAL